MSANFPSESGRIPLLLLPGTLCDEAVFSPLLEQLRLRGAASRRAIVGDMTGLDDVEAAARRILSAAPSQFAVLGFSLGGIVALRIAAMAPRRVRGLALIDSNGADVPKAHHAERRAEAAEGGADLNLYVRQTLWPRYVGAETRDNAALADAIAAMALRGGVRALKAQTDMGLSRPDSRPHLPTMSMPALVLAGEEDALCPPQMQRDLAAGLPNAALALLPGAGHFALMEQPAVVADHVCAWLERVDASADDAPRR